MALNPNAFVDGVMNGFSLHIEPPSYVPETIYIYNILNNRSITSKQYSEVERLYDKCTEAC